MDILDGFFKKLFKTDTENVTSEDEIEVINMLSDEILAEESIFKGNSSKDTNKLTVIPDEIAARVFKDFSYYQFYTLSNPGMVRENNQDSIFTGDFKFYSANRVISAGIGIVADGMGGLSYGETASTASISSVSTYMYARLSEYVMNNQFQASPHSEIILGHIRDAIQNANNIVIEKGRELGEEIGTTLTLAFIFGGIAYFGHVGDSRAYLINRSNKTIEQITKDHSLIGRLVEMGKMTEEEAKTHPRRNEIYRMLGLRNEVQVDTYYRIINKDSIIVLMSDGLWEFVKDEDLFNEIINSNDLSRSANNLIDLANKNGGLDNISVAIIKPVE